MLTACRGMPGAATALAWWPPVRSRSGLDVVLLPVQVIHIQLVLGGHRGLPQGQHQRDHQPVTVSDFSVIGG